MATSNFLTGLLCYIAAYSSYCRQQCRAPLGSLAEEQLAASSSLKEEVCMTEKCWYILTDYGKIVYQDNCLSNLYAT